MKTCQIIDCEKPHEARGYCSTHYASEFRRNRKVGRPVCSVTDCFSPLERNMLCTLHAWREDRYGDPLFVKPKIGRYLDKNSGYVYIYRAGKYQYEHRVLMEEVLGRPLLPGENVHHKNGVRDDNSLENLELWVTSQPSGQRPKDLVAWAKEILRRYEDLVDEAE